MELQECNSTLHYIKKRDLEKTLNVAFLNLCVNVQITILNSNVRNGVNMTIVPGVSCKIFLRSVKHNILQITKLTLVASAFFTVTAYADSSTGSVFFSQYSSP
jgi:hypothetical protein